MQDEYFKDFDGWNIKKKRLDRRKKHLDFFLEGEIWWCSLGINVGIESDGKNFNFERPVLIFKKISLDAFWAIPITSTDIEGTYFYTITCIDGKRTVSLQQLRLVSSKRLIKFMYRVTDEEYANIKAKICQIINMKKDSP